jgi:hypothetical protein
MTGNDLCRQIVLDPDYGGAAVFALSGRGGEVLDRLPISAETREAIREWAKRWDVLASQDLHAETIEDGMMTGSTRRVPEEIWEENDRERRAFWVTLQTELGPDWRVGWSKHFEDGVLNVRWTPDGPLEPLP